jgi:hypothetical protein
MTCAQCKRVRKRMKVDKRYKATLANAKVVVGKKGK